MNAAMGDVNMQAGMSTQAVLAQQMWMAGARPMPPAQVYQAMQSQGIMPPGVMPPGMPPGIPPFPGMGQFPQMPFSASGPPIAMSMSDPSAPSMSASMPDPFNPNGYPVVTPSNRPSQVGAMTPDGVQRGNAGAPTDPRASGVMSMNAQQMQHFQQMQQSGTLPQMMVAMPPSGMHGSVIGSGTAGPSAVTSVPSAQGQGGSGSVAPAVSDSSTGHKYPHSLVDKAVATSNRAAALEKFREKRKARTFTKKIRYMSRKKLAEARPRFRGQFLKHDPSNSGGAAAGNATGSDNTGGSGGAANSASQATGMCTEETGGAVAAAKDREAPAAGAGGSGNAGSAE